MADGNHNAPVRFHDCSMPARTSFQTRRIVSHEDGPGDDFGQDADRATGRPRPTFSVITGDAQ